VPDPVTSSVRSCAERTPAEVLWTVLNASCRPSESQDRVNWIGGDFAVAVVIVQARSFAPDETE
jgi:hypothetical protein